MSLFLVLLLLAPAGPEALPWIHDDLDQAQAAAKATGKPLVIDFWAPWCHTCLSMQGTVLTRAALGPLVDQFTWLSADTDRPENAALVARFPPSFWPTFLVLDGDGRVLARLAGGASTEQFKAFLNDARNAGDPLASGLADAEARAAQGDQAGARDAFDAVLKAAPADWVRRPDVLVSALGARYRLKDWPDCLRFAQRHMANAGAARSASAADFTYFAGACADQAPGPQANAVRRAAILVIEAVLSAGGRGLSVDDRSDALRLLREHHLALKDEPAAKAAALRQVAVLDAAVNGTAGDLPPTAATLMAAWPRAEVYDYLGRAAELVPELEAAMRAHPQAYDPPYRLAWVLLQSKQADAAVAPAEAAARLVYGPRKVRVLQLLASIHEARGDAEAVAQSWARVVAAIEALPASQQKPADLEAARAKARTD